MFLHFLEINSYIVIGSQEYGDESREARIQYTRPYLALAQNKDNVLSNRVINATSESQVAKNPFLVTKQYKLYEKMISS